MSELLSILVLRGSPLEEMMPGRGRPMSFKLDGNNSPYCAGVGTLEEKVMIMRFIVRSTENANSVGYGSNNVKSIHGV
jgi:hypothetical protein